VDELVAPSGNRLHNPDRRRRALRPAAARPGRSRQDGRDRPFALDPRHLRNAPRRRTKPASMSSSPTRIPAASTHQDVGRTFPAPGAGSATRGPGESQLETTAGWFATTSRAQGASSRFAEHRRDGPAGPSIGGLYPTVPSVAYTNAGKSTLLMRSWAQKSPGPRTASSPRSIPTSRQVKLERARRRNLTDTVAYPTQTSGTSFVELSGRPLRKSTRADVLVEIVDAWTDTSPSTQATVQTVSRSSGQGTARPRRLQQGRP